MQTTPRFFINKSQIVKKRFLLEDERIVRHIGLVLRLKVGDKIILFDGEGSEYEAKLGFITKKQAAGVVESEYLVESTAASDITLAQSLPRAGKLDDIVRMNTEVGVAKFILFESEYSVAKAESVTEAKLFRLSKVAVEALRQSEGNIVPTITGAIKFKELLALSGFDAKILLHSRNTLDSKSLVEIKNGLNLDAEESKNSDSAKPNHVSSVPKLLIIIGPEGGFSPKEVKLAEENNCKIAYLNLPILRTETAGVVVTSYLLQK